MLYDFGVERDLLRRSQAAALLSYESSSSDISGNSTWLALAVQHARIINAHLYDHLPENGSYKRSDLKRLWWSLILRDRIIALGMRRPLQILPSSFEVAFPEILQLQDFADEKHSSKVYDPEIKSALCDIISSQCSLAIALTPLIMTIYPPDQISGSSENLTSLLDRAEDAKLRLQYWRSQHGFLFSTPQKEGHTSITLFKLLTALYYEYGPQNNSFDSMRRLIAPIRTTGLAALLCIITLPFGATRAGAFKVLQSYWMPLHLSTVS